MTLPSQSPRSGSPTSSGARNAQNMRSLFIAVAAIGLGGAAAGWFLTHKSESAEVEAGTGVAAEATIVDPLATGTTATEHGRALDFVVNLRRRTLQRASQSLVPLGGEITLESVGILVFKTRRDDARAIADEESRCVCVTSLRAHSAAFPSIQTGASVTSSGGTAPTARSGVTR